MSMLWQMVVSRGPIMHRIVILFFVLIVATIGCGRRQVTEPDSSGPVPEILRENSTSTPIVYHNSVLVVEFENSETKYCVVPPLGRNPFAAGSLEENANVDLYSTITDLAKAIRECPTNVKVTVADPNFFQPSKYKLRALNKEEFSQITAFLTKAPTEN